MKQNALQMLLSVYGNFKKLKLFIKLLVKFIRKIIGKQKTGKRRVNLEFALGGILYYVKSGCQWRLLPNEFGKWRTIYGWYSRLNKLNIFGQVWEFINNFAVNCDKISLKRLLIDGSLLLTTSPIELKSKNPRMKSKNCVNRLIMTNGKGIPLVLHLAKGTAHDSTFLPELLAQVNDKYSLTKGFYVHGDKGFDSLKNRLFISRMQGLVEIPLRNHGFTIPYPSFKDKKRPIIEHTFAWINAFKNLKTISTSKLQNLYQNHFLVFAIITSRFLTFKDMNMLIKST